MRYRTQRWTIRICAVVVCSILSIACSLDGLVDVDDPEAGREIDRNTIRSYSGALSVYYSTISSFAATMSILSRDVGIITDELQARGVAGDGADYGLDARQESIGVNGQRRLVGKSYSYIHSTRVQASHARTLLKKYGLASSAPLVSNTYAIEGFSILLLAELYCSGIPLSEVPFEGEIQYTKGYLTTELFEHAIAMFDSALQINHDSVPVLTLARIGKGRALLGVQKYQDAALAVKDVATTDKFLLQYADYTTIESSGLFWTASSMSTGAQSYVVGNFEGTSGIQWLADSADNQDARVPVTVVTQEGRSVYASPTRQQKFVGGVLDLVVADGVQARLIEAEAQLSDTVMYGGLWLQTLNLLRQREGLSDTTDPGTYVQRVSLLFRERAYWLYLTGTRLADMRRLVRQYRRNPYQVYPSGVYLAGGYETPFYGEAYLFSPPDTEVDLNHRYIGCVSRNP